MSRVGRTRPRDRATVVLAALLALAVGLGTGYDRATALRVVLAVVVSLVLLVRVEWAALAVVTTAVFASYLDALSPWTTDWLAGVLVLAWVVRRAAGPLHHRGWPLVAVPVAALAALVLLSLSAHPLSRGGLGTGARWVELLVVLLVLADVLTGPLRPERAARAYVLSCCAAAACGLVTAVLTDPHRVSGPLAHPDELAFFLVAALPLVRTLRGARTSASWVLTPSPRAVSWPSYACFGLLALGLLGTQSRAAYVAAVVVLAGSAATRVLSPQHAGAALVLAATAVAFVLAVLPHPVGGALSDPSRSAETGVGQRLEQWHAALDVLGGSPALGVGPGGLALREAVLRPGQPGSASSTLLQAAAELGLLGAAALVAVVAVPVLVLLRRRRHDALPAAVLVATAGAVVAALLETQTALLPLVLLVALASSLASSQASTSAASSALARLDRSDPGVRRAFRSAAGR